MGLARVLEHAVHGARTGSPSQLNCSDEAALKLRGEHEPLGQGVVDVNGMMATFSPKCEATVVMTDVLPLPGMPCSMLSLLYGTKFPGHTTTVPQVGFKLATNCCQLGQDIPTFTQRPMNDRKIEQRIGRCFGWQQLLINSIENLISYKNK